MDKEKLKDQCLVLRGGVMELRAGGFEIGNSSKLRYAPQFPLDFTMQKSDWDKEKIIKKDYDPDWTKPYSLVICKYSRILGKLTCGPVHNVCLPSYNPTTSDITLALLILQEDMSKKRQRLKESRSAFLLNHQKLKEKPLLIKKSQVSPQNSIKELEDNYAHKLEVVEDSIFDRMILTANTSYYYLYPFSWVSPWVKNQYGVHRILDISKPMTIGLQPVGHGFVTADIVKSYETSKEVTQEEEEEVEEEENGKKEKKKGTEDKKKGKN
jgi:hypothetical protein